MNYKSFYSPVNTS